ncbi:MAG: Crp/Fnr family transcriptional regulator [Sphaerochaetaceae bacterium]
MDGINLIKNTSLFKNVKNVESLFLERKINLKTYSKGKTLHSEGEICDTLDIVLKGLVIAYSLFENGSQTVMFEFQEDSMFGANLLYSKNNTYPLNLYCKENCTLLHVKKDTVTQLLHQFEFVMPYVVSLSTNSLGLNSKMTMFSRKSLRSNILNYLEKLKIDQNSNKIILPTSKKELADYFGVQRQSLFRELKAMKKEGLLEINNRLIKLN